MCQSIMLSRSASSHISRKAQVLRNQPFLNVSDTPGISHGPGHLCWYKWNKPWLFLTGIQLINDDLGAFHWNTEIKKAIKTWSMFFIEMFISRCSPTLFDSSLKYPVIISFQSWQSMEGNHTKSLTQRLLMLIESAGYGLGSYVPPTFQSYTRS